MSQKPLARKYSAFLALGFVALIVLLWLTHPEPVLELAPERRMQVDVAEVTQASFQPMRRLSGYLQPRRTAELRFEVDGVIASQGVEVGQPVTTGQVLLTLHDADHADLAREAAARLQQETLAVARDRRLLQLAADNVSLQQQEVARQEKLGDQSLASRSALDTARRLLLQLQAEQAQLQFSVDSAEARLAIQRSAAQRAQRNLERSQLRAPFAGIVNQIAVEEGDYIGARDIALTLVDLSQLEFYGEVEGDVARQLALGQEVMLDVDGRQLPAEIIALQAAANITTATHTIRLRLDNPGLVAGSLATAQLPLQQIDNALVVPSEAIVRADGEIFVFIVNYKTLERRKVVLGPRQSNQQVVLQGVNKGDIVVARDGAALAHGQVVDH